MALLSDDEVFGAAPAAPTGLLSDEDLFGAAPAVAPTPEVGLGERMWENAKSSFRNSLAGGNILSGSGMDSYAQEMDIQSRVLPPDYPVFVPNPDGGLFSQGTTGTMPEAADAARAAAEKQRAQYQADEQRYNQIPAWDASGSALDKTLAGGAALLGQLGGGLLSPENLVPVGRGATVAKTFLKGAAVNGAVNAAVDPVVQQYRIDAGVQDEYSLAQTALSAALGGAIGGGINVAPELLAGARSFLASRLGKAPEAITQADVAGLSKADIEAMVAEQTVAPTLSPAETIAATTGMNAPEPLAPKSQERRQAQRELADVFAQPEVQRRGSLDENGEVIPGAEPVRDGTGTAVSADRLAAIRAAKAQAERAGIKLDEEQLQTAATYIERGVNPAEAMNTFRRAARSGEMRDVPLERDAAAKANNDQLAEEAFRLADIRRQRREADLAAGNQPRPDYQAGALDDGTYSPRLEQDLAARSKAPPKGVNLGQPGAPRSAVDRISSKSTQPFISEGELLPAGPKPATDAPRSAGEVFDGESTPVQGLPAPDKRLESPRPSEEMIVGPDGQPRRLTEAEAEALARVRKEQSDLGLTSDVRRAQDMRNPKPAQSDLDRALAMTEDDYIRSVNPEGKTISEDDKVLLSIGDLEAPAGAAPVKTFKAKDGSDIDVVRGQDGAMYAKRGDDVLGEMRTYDDGETVINVVQEAQGQGVGRGLATEFIRENPLAKSGGFSPAGEANRRSAFRQLQAERGQVDTLQAVGENGRSTGRFGPKSDETVQPKRGMAGAGGREVPAQPGQAGLDAPARMDSSAPGREAPVREVAARQQPDEIDDARLDEVFNRSYDDTPANAVDPRLNDDTASQADAFLESTRWDERGGQMTRDAEGNASGRTKWLSSDPEIQRVLTDNRVTAETARQLVKRAHSGKGKPLTEKQRGIVQSVMDVIEERSGALDAERRWVPDDEPVLSGYSESDLKARDADTRQANDTAEQASRKTQEDRAQADKDRNDFTLTGSDRPSDVAAARGQDDMFQPGKLYDVTGALVDAAKYLAKRLGGKPEEWKASVAEFNSIIKDLGEAAGGLKAGNRASQRSVAVSVWRGLLASTDGNMRALAGGFKSRTMASLADEFHATAGRGDGVKQTFGEATEAHQNPRLQEVDRIMAALRDNGLGGNQEQIIKLVENPRAPRAGKAGEIARRIDKFFREELAYMREAGVEVGEVKTGYFPRSYDAGMASANRDGFIDAATRAYMKDGAPRADAAAKAVAFWESTVYGVSGTPGFRPAGGASAPSFVQGRAFSKEASDLMTKFQVRDIDAVMGQYVRQATRRAEIARRFGDNWSKWADIEAKIKAEDPKAEAMFPDMRELVATSAGIVPSGGSSGLKHTLSALRTLTTLATLPKAAAASMGELIISPMRASTGNVPADIGLQLKNLFDVMHDATRAVTGLGRDEKTTRAFALAEDLGIIAGVGHNSLMAARFANGDPLGRTQSKILAGFFRNNGLEYLTNYTRVRNTLHGQVLMRRLAKLSAAGKEPRANFFARELGIPAGKEKGFLDFVANLGDDVPEASALTGQYGQMYRTALQRYADQATQRPNNSTRPQWANTWWGGVPFQLQSFGYAFQKNFINRQVRILAGKNDLSAMDRALYATTMLPQVALLVGVQGLVSMGMDEIYRSEGSAEKTDGAKLETALSRAGLFGVADPFIQSLSGVRYQRSPVAAFAGPALGGLAQASGEVAAAGLNNSENSNNAERGAYKALYSWVLAPVMQAGLAVVPGAGPLANLVKAGSTVAGVPLGRDKFVDAAGGEKAERKQKPISGFFESMLSDDKPASSGSGGRGNRGGRGGERGR